MKEAENSLIYSKSMKNKKEVYIHPCPWNNSMPFSDDFDGHIYTTAGKKSNSSV